MTEIETQAIRPAPIRKTLRVRATPQKAFDVFVKAMGSWWLEGHSLLSAPQDKIVIEPVAGGRWFELGVDGSEAQWGGVKVWDEPRRVVLAWQLTSAWVFDPEFSTEVEITFTPDGDETVVAFEHRDLERYGDKAAEQRNGMDVGWGALLDSFGRAANAAAD